MANPPNYTENVPQMIESDWKSDDTFTYSIISDVFKAANDNLESIFPYYKDIKQCKINEEDLLDTNYCGEYPDVGEILDDFHGPAVYIGMWLGLTIIFTIIGVIWCIYNKCCCCCKSRKINDLDYLINTESDEDLRNIGIYQVNRKNNTQLIWKVVVGVLMAFWIIGFSFSVFMSFASNEGLRTSIYELYDDLDLSVDDAEMYINITKRQIDATFVTSYGNLSDRILDEIPPETYRSQVNSETILHTSDVLLLKLRDLSNPGSEDDEKSKQLLELTVLLNGLQTILKETLSPFLSRLEIVKKSVTSDVEEALLKTKQQLDANVNDIKDALDKVDIKEFRDQLEDADEWLDVTGSAIYGSFMGLNLVLLLILVGIVIGTVVVWIAKGSTRTIGFMFYRFSIVMMFVFGWIIVCVMITQFVISGFMIHDACEAVKDLENNSTDWVTTQGQGFAPLHLDKKLSLVDTAQNNVNYLVPTYRYVTTHCKNDDSAYVSFRIDQVYNASTIREISNNFNLTISQGNKMSAIEDVFFIKNVNSIYPSLYHELVKLGSFKDVVAETSKSKSLNGTEILYSTVQLQLVSLLQEIKNLESRNFAGTMNNIIDLVEGYEEFVYDQMTSKIGKCLPIYHGINATLHQFCYKVLVPVATYWWALQLLLVMFVTIIATALISERVFK